MPRPGVYRPDPSEGITRPEELPQPQLIYSCRDLTQHPCPYWGFLPNPPKGYSAGMGSLI
jgi:hypothetical protein